MVSGALLAQLAWRFLLMAFIAIGGANAIVPEMHRQVVELERWMSDGEFAALFAIANVAPGPNLLIVTLIGWQVAGVAGALVTTAAFIVPTSCLTYALFGLWNRFRDAPWRRPVQNGLSAVTVGLIAASALLLSQAAATSPATVAILLGTAAFAYGTKLNPLWAFGAAAAIGAVALA
jgi:chromate transporter